MGTSPLTGRDAVEAISLAARLGNSNARFDRRALSAALRTRAGRLRIMAGYALRAAVPTRFHVMRQSREPTTARRALGAHQSPVLGSEAPERPDTPGRPDADVGAYNAFPWAAGVFDACGTITRCRSRLRLAFNTTDEQAVRRFHEAVGVGKVYGPYANSGHDTSPRQPFFIWLVEGAPAGTLAQRLRPWLSPTRRDRLDEVIG